jgi:hypothetical protein
MHEVTRCRHRQFLHLLLLPVGPPSAGALTLSLIMGDCRIRVQASIALIRRLGRQTSESSASSASATTGSAGRDDAHTSADVPDPTAVLLLEAKNWASDATIRELMEELSIPASLVATAFGSKANEQSTGAEVPSLRVLDLLESHAAKLWDCTRFPPVDITSWSLILYPDHVGLKSRTLYDAGWFPSGTLLLLPYEQSSPSTSSKDALHDDPQYNRVVPTSAADPSRRVELQGSMAAVTGNGASRPPPSQVMAAVSCRFASDSVENEPMRDAAALAERAKNRATKRAAEESRLQKLEDRIRKLDEDHLKSTKNKTVSDQVQRMLIKSRASGRSDLKVRDRFYLRCLVDDGISTKTEEFRYFSHQDTVGRILSSFFCSTKPMSELLVRRQKSYRRLPVLSRVCELVANNHLSEFDRVVVRWYDPTIDDGPTSSVDDNTDVCDTVAEQAPEANKSRNHLTPASDSDRQEREHPAVNGETTHDGPSPTAPLASTRTDLDRQLHDALAMHDQGTKQGKAAQRSKSAAASSAASIKVRQMQMKGRAVGDKKRVAKDHDRFYVELVTVVVDDAVDDSSEATIRVVESTAVFMARTDPISRLFRDCVRSDIVPTSGSTLAHIDLYVPNPSTTADTAPSFRRIEDSTATFADAERDGVVKCFDRVVAYVRR